MKENDITLNWNKYDWRDFEIICFEYLKTIYAAKFYKTILTEPRNDGGRDIIVKKKDNSFEAWGECKNHKRNIDLSVIGKNVVLALSHKINKAIFFSVSPITYNTKVEILNLSQVYNFDILFLDGDRLNQEILACKSVAKKYFKTEYKKYVESLKHSVYIETFLSEFPNAETECEKEKKQYHLKNGFEIYLHVLINNLQKISISGGKIIINTTTYNDCIFYNNSKTIDVPIMEYSEKMYTFSGLILSPKSNIKIPVLKFQFTFENGDVWEQTIDVGTIDASDVWRAPYINSQSATFLADVIHELQETIPDGYARIFYICGKSGTGKSRLLKEIENKARELSYKIIHIDFRDQNDVCSIRHFFCRWLCLPNPRDTVSFEYQDFCDTIKKEINNKEYQRVLFEFLYCGKDEVNSNILEKVFFKHIIDYPVLFTIDNIQETNTDTQILLWNIASSCRNRNIPVVLAFSMNTEMRIGEKNLLVSYLDSIGGESTENYITSYICNSLKKEDAISIIQELLHLNPDTDQYIDSIIEKIGTLPLNLLFFAKKLTQTTGIFGQAHGKRFIADSNKLNTKLTDFMRDEKNSNYKISRYIYDNYFTYRSLLELMVLFEGNLPTSIAELCGFPMSTIKSLCKDLVLRLGNAQTVIMFYNDQILNYLQCKSLEIPMNFYETIADYYENTTKQDEKHFNILSNVYLRALISIGKTEDAKSYGSKLLNRYEASHANRDVCYVCTQLCSLYSLNNELEEYVNVALIKADYLLERINLYEADQIFEEIKYIVDTKSSFLSHDLITHFFHRYINQKLHTGRYKEALNTLKEFEKGSIHTENSYYIIHDRYCVAYFNMGNIKKAVAHIDNTICKADNNNNETWLSIAYSDKAFAYFYNGGKNEDVIRYFKQAVELHELIDNKDISREIEIRIQESLYRILEGDWLDADKSIQKAIIIAEEVKYSYLILPAYNLQAYILTHSKKYESALKILKKALSNAIIFSNQRALVSIYNNLGVIHILNNSNNHHEAIESFYSSNTILNMHPEWVNNNLRYIGLKYNIQKIENNHFNEFDKNIFLFCDGFYFLYQ